ncbi:MAG: prolipoprotein diacylglyceryl transferase [Firmicutes bacterium]|nr:prolipoprotein diacylglyceryl transferase [Bacillota bacterium]
MRPVLIEVFGIPVFSYGFMMAVAFLAGYFLVLRRFRELGLSLEKLADFAVILAVSGIIGARLLYVLIGWEYYSAHPAQIFNLPAGGLSFHGGAVLAVITGVYYVRRQRLPLGKIADAIAPAFALGVALVRIGCLLNGCCYGLPSTVPWAFDSSYLHDVPRHPTQLYESLAMFLVFLYLLKREKHTFFPGYLLVLFTVLYSASRFIIEFFRDVPEFWPPLTMAQVASLFFIVLGTAVIVVGQKRFEAQKNSIQGEQDVSR